MIGRLDGTCNCRPLFTPNSPLNGRTDKSREQRMRFRWLAFELWMELNSKKERMRWKFQNLDQAAVWALSGKSHSMGFKSASKYIVKFVPMSMPLADLVCLIGQLRHRIFR